MVNHLVDVVAPSTKDRTSGYTRIVKLGRRRGDNTLMARLELVDSFKTKDEPKQAKAKRDTKPAKKAKAKTNAPKIDRQSLKPTQKPSPSQVQAGQASRASIQKRGEA